MEKLTVYREPEDITKAKGSIRLMQKGIKFRIYPNREQKTVRKWECPKCHIKHDRDANASVNILKKGLQIQSA